MVKAINKKLFDAVIKEDLSEVNSLLQRGANPDEFTTEDPTHRGVLYEAVFAENEKILEALLNAGANPSMKSTAARYTLLHVAVRSESNGCVQLLLNAGANPNEEDVRGVTPLHDASKFKLNKIGKQLIEAILSKNSKENKPSFLSENQELSSAWDSCRDNKRVFKVMNYIESNLDKRLKKPFVSKDYTPEEKKHLIQGLQMALECKEINAGNISAIHATMNPGVRSRMRFPIRRGGVTINITQCKSKEGLWETLDWLDKHQAGYGPRFEIAKVGAEKPEKYFANINELREDYGCKSNLELATKLEFELKAANKEKIFRVVPIFDSLNYCVDTNPSSVYKTVEYQDIEEDLKEAGYLTYEVVESKFSQLVDRFNESKKPSIKEIASFIKEMILLHPYVDGNGRTFTLGVLNSALYNHNYGICLDLDPDIVSSTNNELVDDIMKNLVPMSQLTLQEAGANVNAEEVCQMTVSSKHCTSLHSPAVQGREEAAVSLQNAISSLEQENNKHTSVQSTESKQPASVAASYGGAKSKDASQFQHSEEQTKKGSSALKAKQEAAAAIDLLKQGNVPCAQFITAVNNIVASSSMMRSSSCFMFANPEKKKGEFNNKDKDSEKKKLEERQLRY